MDDSSSGTKKTTATTDEVIASVKITLASWNQAFEPPLNEVDDEDNGGVENDQNNNTVEGGGGGGGDDNTTRKKQLTTMVRRNNRHRPLVWRDTDAYQRRLSTFRPNTYFAKPLALSPLVCAAFGWENSGKDIINCRQANCNAAICIVFHPSLTDESRDRLCAKYTDLLATSHSTGCAFRSFANRWVKMLHHCSSSSKNNGEEGVGWNTAAASAAEQEVQPVEAAIPNAKELSPEDVMNKVSNDLMRRSNTGGDDSNKTKFYVPPYLLPLSEVFLRFEDYTTDGSITKDLVREGALEILDKLRARRRMDGAEENLDKTTTASSVDLMIPDAVSKFCHEVAPDADVDKVLYDKDDTMKVASLLSIFGWGLCDESMGKQSSMVAKCAICQARAWLSPPTQLSSVDSEESARKKRRIDSRSEATLKLLDSHRVYCPYVSGFGPADLPGWKVVVSCLMKFDAFALRGSEVTAT